MKFLAIALSTLFSTTVLAFPGGAPVCPVDGPAPQGKHLREGNTNGSLEFGGVTVAIDGCELEVGVPFEIAVFETVTVTISRDSFYRGVLARFNIDQAIGLVEDEMDLQISTPCSNDGVIGVTHTDRNDKTEVSFKVVIMEEQMGIPFAVDIVERNDSLSVWFHSMFTVDALYPAGKGKKGRGGKGKKCKMTKSSKSPKKSKGCSKNGGGRLLRDCP